MSWWQALVVALATYAVTKLIDLLIVFTTEKREFKKHRRELALSDIEKLKDEVGTLYELAANWKSFGEKQKAYIEAFERDHELIGRLHKYPLIAPVARDAVHWCKIVAEEERSGGSGSTVEQKQELARKFKVFLDTCENYLDDLV